MQRRTCSSCASKILPQCWISLVHANHHRFTRSHDGHRTDMESAQKAKTLVLSAVCLKTSRPTITTCHATRQSISRMLQWAGSTSYLDCKYKQEICTLRRDLTLCQCRVCCGERSAVTM